jgi:hypothetical protein
LPKEPNSQRIARSLPDTGIRSRGYLSGFLPAPALLTPRSTPLPGSR